MLGGWERDAVRTEPITICAPREGGPGLDGAGPEASVAPDTEVWASGPRYPSLSVLE